MEKDEENEAKDDKNAEQTVDVIATEDSKDTSADKEAVDTTVTEDAVGANADKKNFVSVDLKNTLIMGIVALISIVSSFIFVSKIFTPLEENDFEVQDVDIVPTVGRTKDVPQGNTNIKQEDKKRDTNIKKENKKGKTNNVKKANVEKDNNDDISNEEEAGGVQGILVVPLEGIVVNLGGVNSNRYLRLQISLGVENENAQNIIIERTVILRDKMISFFSRKTAKAVETEGGLMKLRLEIKDVLNKLLGSDKIIKQVYFSDFIVQ